MPEDELKALCSIGSTPDIVSDAKTIVEQSQTLAFRYVNRALVLRNWLLGRRISEEVLKGGNKENYGKRVIVNLSKELTDAFGKGFQPSSLYDCVCFYEMFPEILHTLNGKSFFPLSWSHYRILLQVKDDSARQWYAREAAEQAWAVRTLQRNVSTQYYYRMVQAPDPKEVESEMRALTVDYQRDKAAFVKDPVVIEFLGMKPDASFTESKLESMIIGNIQKFLLEMGKGYAFVARQQRIHTEKEDYFIDLVFYNIYLKCYVLVDLKTSRITHQDVGQMDMYVRMYDELKRVDGDNPTLGIVLCSETDEDIARYSVLHDNDRLFASRYRMYLPSEDELRREIEAQKQIYLLRESEKDGKGDERAGIRCTGARLDCGIIPAWRSRRCPHRPRPSRAGHRTRPPCRPRMPGTL
jgi:predicted nuclease of restriction endonuclease-like (RecB) superfamily